MVTLLAFLLPAFVPVSPISPPSARTAAKPSVPPAMPAPRITRRIPGWSLGSKFSGLKTTTPKNLVLETGEETRHIIALDRARPHDQGVESVHWEKETQWIDLSDQDIRAHWNVLGSVSVQNGKPIASPIIVLERQVVFTRYASEKNPNPQPETQTVFYGMQDETHIPKWQFPARNAPPNTALSAFSLLGGLLPIRTEGSDTLAFWDAQTGMPVDAKTPEGKAALSEAIRQKGTPLIQEGRKLYRLDTGTTVTFPYREILGIETLFAPMGVTADRAFWREGGDDGWTGHSGWPTYLSATDETGKFLWRFPEYKEQTYMSTGEGEGGGGNDPSPDIFTLANAQDNGDAVAVVSVTHEIGGASLFGLQARTGKRLWRRKLPGILDIVAQNLKSSTVFVFRAFYNEKTGVVEKVELDGLNAATGKTVKAWTLPKNIGWIAAAGDDLLLIDYAGLVRIYSCQKLLGK